MRTRFVEFCATAVSLIVGSCAFPRSSSPSCDDDLALCPRSSRAATSVRCSCRCTVGLGGKESSAFEGQLTVCLPAALNTKTATDEQRAALATMDPRVFDQLVFAHCSGAVAGFARLAVKAHMSAHPNMRLAACVLPVSCECDTTGAQLDWPACHSSCPEVPCDDQNCSSVLREDGKLDVAACACSRSRTCGDAEPREAEAGVCHEGVASLQ